MQYRVRKQNELKPSGIEWLGDIPKDWNISKLKYSSLIFNGATPKSSNIDYWDGDIIWITPQDISKNSFLFTSKRMITRKGYDSCGTSLVPKGSIILTTRAPIGNISIADVALCTNQGCKSIFIKNRNNMYIYYYLMSSVQILQSLGSGTTFLELPTNALSSFLVPKIMDLEEIKIANFLDEKSKVFDTAILKKEELILKLEEAKQSLISEVVTGKLKVITKDRKLQTIKREKEELKTSAVDWIGDIPKDWQVKKSKYLFEIRKRIAGKLGYDVLSITQKGIKIKDIKTGGGQLSMDYSKYQIVNVGDFAMNHMDLLTGFVDISKVEGVTSPDYRVFTLIDEDSIPNYYLYLFQMGYKNEIFFAFGQGSSQLGRWRFPTDQFKNFYFPYPLKDEQELISKYLDDKLIHFENTIEKTKQSIEKLKQAKESLISEAVTGKIEIL